MDIPWHRLTTEKIVTKFQNLRYLSKNLNKAFEKHLWSS